MATKKVMKPDVVRGGIAIPLKGKTNYYYMSGRKHKNGGIDIGRNPHTGLEVEDGEVMHIADKEIKVFSSVPFLNGKSPAQKILGGENPDTVFKEQEAFKDRNGLNDDGTRKRMGGLSRSKDYGSKSKPYPNVKSKDFAGSNRSYPIPTKADAVDALRLAGLHGRDDIKANVYSKYPELRKKKLGGDDRTLPEVLITPNIKDNLTYLKMLPYVGEKDARDLIREKNAIMKELTTPETHGGKFGGGTFGGNGAGGRFIVPKNYTSVGTFNEAFDKAYNTGEAEFKYGEKFYNTNKEKNPIRERNNRFVGSSKSRAKLKATDDYEYGIGPYRLRGLEHIPIVMPNTPNTKKRYKAGGVYSVTVNGETRLKRFPSTGSRTKAALGTLDNNSSEYLKRNRKRSYIWNPSDFLTTPISLTRNSNTSDIPDYLKRDRNNSNTVSNNLNFDWAKYNDGRLNIQNHLYSKDEPKEFISPLQNNVPKENYVPPILSTVFGNTSTSNTSTKNPKVEKSDKIQSDPSVHLVNTIQPVDMDIKPLNKPFHNVLARYPIKLPRESIYFFPSSKPFQAFVDNTKDYIKEHPDTISDAIGLTSNTIGGIISHNINRRMLDKLDYFPQPMARSAAKLKTRININPQLDKMRESLAAYENDINNSTSSSNVALARRQRARFANTLQTNNIYANRENTETELINKDRLNQQSVADANIRDYNTWLQNQTTFRNSLLEKKAENDIGLIETINSGVQNLLTNREKRNAEKQNVAALVFANPDLPVEELYEQGFINKQVRDAYIQAYRTRKNNTSTNTNTNTNTNANTNNNTNANNENANNKTNVNTNTNNTTTNENTNNTNTNTNNTDDKNDKNKKKKKTNNKK